MNKLIVLLSLASAKLVFLVALRSDLLKLLY